MIKENEFKTKVAKNLIYYRKANNLTQSDLAQKLNYSDKAISKWERGENLPDLYILTTISSLYGITLNDWLEAHKKDNAKYLVYLDDDKAMDGGHIVCAYCYPDKLYFIDTFDCGEMFVQAWTKVKKVIPKDSDQHWKYDKQLKKFI